MIPLLTLFSPALAAAPEPYALVQLWGTAWDADEDPQADSAGYGDPEDDAGFKIRRARIGLRSEGDDPMFYAVIFGIAAAEDGLSTGDPTVGVVDSYAGWRFSDSFSAAAGVQKVPFGREQLMSSREIVFEERTVSSNHIGPGRDTGVVLDGTLGGARLRLGGFNGASNPTLGDWNDGMLLAGRAEYTLGDPDEAYTTWGRVDGLVLGAGANGMFNRDLATDELDGGADLLLRVSGLALLLEGHFASIRPTATDVAAPGVLQDTKRLGALAQVGWSFGPWEPALRAEYFDDSTAVTDNGDLAIVYAGATGHFAGDALRLGGAWIGRFELGGRDVPNDTLRFWVQARY